MQVADNSSDLRSRLSTLYFTRPYRRFLVSRMGSTGSTWLVKLLNSHPDVFCYHEGALSGIFPRETYGSEDIVRFIELLAQEEMHGAYKAMGDVGSAWVDHLTALPRGTFTTAILLRHPARLLNTRLKIFKADKSFTEIDKSLLSQVEQAWGIKASCYDEMDQIFLQDAFIFASQIQAIKLVDLVIHIGQMKDIDYCRDVLHRLSGLHYEHSLVARAIARPINRRSGSRHASVKEILSSFSDEQRAWYRLMLEEVLPVCGYALEEDEEDELRSPELAIGVEEGERAGRQPS